MGFPIAMFDCTWKSMSPFPLRLASAGPTDQPQGLPEVPWLTAMVGADVATWVFSATYTTGIYKNTYYICSHM